MNRKVYPFVFGAFFIGGCTTLNSESDFSDAIDSVRERKNYVEVVSKDYSPEFLSIKGPGIIKSSLVVNGFFPKNDGRIPDSSIDFEVSYFQAHDEYQRVLFNGRELPLKPTLATSSSCNEHCTVTQYVTFPIEASDLEQAVDDGLKFQLKSSSGNMVTQFELPANLVQAVVEEATGYSQLHTESPVQTPESPSHISKNQEMVEYWLSEASDEDKAVFADWAFSSADLTTSEVEARSKPLEMMVYWFNKSSKSEKISILSALAK